MNRIAACITPHGFGHATRTIAVLEALQSYCPALEIVLITTAPKHLFEESLKNITLHPIITDIGIVQHDALSNNIPETIAALDTMLQTASKTAKTIAEAIKGSDVVICDISPLGILAAKEAKIPSILIENFTWDWIYKDFATEHPDIVRAITAISQIYEMTDYRIQVEPVCNPISAVQTVPPVFRERRLATRDIKDSLNVSDKELIIISMGGINFSIPEWQQVNDQVNYYFVLAGQSTTEKISDNCLALGRDSKYYHPDLIAAADLVICKSGYSTVAECYQGGTRICCIIRPDFAESKILEQFVCHRMKGTLLTENDFVAGRWIPRLPEMLTLPGKQPAKDNGADHIARILLTI